VSADRSKGGRPEARTSTGTAIPTDPAELERAILEQRAKVAATVDELVERARPREVLRRALADARRRLHEATHTPDGALRVERVSAIAAAGVVLIAGVVWLRRRNR